MHVANVYSCAVAIVREKVKADVTRLRQAKTQVTRSAWPSTGMAEFEIGCNRNNMYF